MPSGHLHFQDTVPGIGWSVLLQAPAVKCEKGVGIVVADFNEVFPSLHKEGGVGRCVIGGIRKQA